MATGEPLAVEHLPAVSNTALLTLWARAMEARSVSPILDDPTAIAIVETLRPQITALASPFYQQLATDQVPKLLTTLMALRARFFDDAARNFLARFPHSVIVNLGAGLDTRFERLDADRGRTSGAVRVIDIDLPPVTALKRQFATPHPRHELVAASVLDERWLDALARYDDRRCIFLAEGLLMYFSPDEAKRLMVMLAERFAGSEIVADVFHARWLRPPWRGWANRKMQRQLHMPPDAAFHFGLDSPAEMTAWHPQLIFLDEWSFFDDNESKLGWMRLFRHIHWLRRIQYVVRYQVG